VELLPFVQPEPRHVIAAVVFVEYWNKEPTVTQGQGVRVF